MIRGCKECEASVVQANMNLHTQGESWLVHDPSGHSHPTASNTEGYLVHLVDTRRQE